MASYLLNENHKPIVVSDEEWAKKWNEQKQILCSTYYDSSNRCYCISTVFLGMDHGFGWSPKPVLFETMIFGVEMEGYDGGEYCERYCTYDEAVEGHVTAFNWLRGRVGRLDTEEIPEVELKDALV